MSDIGVDDATRGNFVSAFGVCMVAGGKLCGASIRNFGPRGHTTLNNILTILSVSDGTAVVCTHYVDAACAIDTDAHARAAALLWQQKLQS